MKNQFNNNRYKDYEIWSERIEIADVFRSFGLKNIAGQVHTEHLNQAIINDYIKIAHKLALNLNDNDVVERLYMTGLLSGKE